MSAKFEFLTDSFLNEVAPSLSHQELTGCIKLCREVRCGLEGLAEKLERLRFIKESKRDPDRAQNLSASLQRKGWSIQEAAAELAVERTHLFRVVTGRRSSRSLAQRVEKLPNKNSTQSN